MMDGRDTYQNGEECSMFSALLNIVIDEIREEMDQRFVAK